MTIMVSLFIHFWNLRELFCFEYIVLYPKILNLFESIKNVENIGTSVVWTNYNNFKRNSLELFIQTEIGLFLDRFWTFHKVSHRINKTI